MKCKVCEKEETPSNYINESEMIEHQMCFFCNFWRDMLEKDSKRLSHTWCVIDGTHYVIEPDDPGNYFQGFGGAEFQIEFNDGHRVVTHNLWCQGDIDPAWRDKFPDNARFENNLKWTDINGTKYLIKQQSND